MGSVETVEHGLAASMAAMDSFVFIFFSGERGGGGCSLKLRGESLKKNQELKISDNPGEATRN